MSCLWLSAQLRLFQPGYHKLKKPNTGALSPINIVAQVANNNAHFAGYHQSRI